MGKKRGGRKVAKFYRTVAKNALIAKLKGNRDDAERFVIRAQIAQLETEIRELERVPEPERRVSLKEREARLKVLLKHGCSGEQKTEAIEELISIEEQREEVQNRCRNWVQENSEYHRALNTLLTPEGRQDILNNEEDADLVVSAVFDHVREIKLGLENAMKEYYVKLERFSKIIK